MFFRSVHRVCALYSRNFSSAVLYDTHKRVATITLHRPHRLNAITPELVEGLQNHITSAENDDSVHVIVVKGSGKGFCAGYDLKDYAEAGGTNPGVQDMPWEPMKDYAFMGSITEVFMRLWRSSKPTIAQVHGACVAGGSDIALACDLVVMAEDSYIGYPPSRVWGCPTTAMWAYRLGPEKAKRMLLTGDLVSGKEAKEMGLVLEAVPSENLESRVLELAKRISSVPKSQLAMQKLMINSAVDSMGLRQTQMLATLFDGMSRHNPPGVAFKQRAEMVGFQQAVKERDSGVNIPEHPSENP